MLVPNAPGKPLEALGLFAIEAARRHAAQRARSAIDIARRPSAVRPAAAVHDLARPVYDGRRATGTALASACAAARAFGASHSPIVQDPATRPRARPKPLRKLHATRRGLRDRTLWRYGPPPYAVAWVWVWLHRAGGCRVCRAVARPLARASPVFIPSFLHLSALGPPIGPPMRVGGCRSAFKEKARNHAGSGPFPW